MKTKLLSVMAITSLLFAGCAKFQEAAPNSPADEIMLGSSVLTGTATDTRFAYDGTITSANPLKARVIASEDAEMDPLHADGTMTFADAAAVVYDKPLFSGAYIFPGDTPDDDLYLVGLYPVLNQDGNGWAMVAGDQIGIAFTGCEDVMFAPRVTTSANEVGGANYSTLAFVHALTRLTLAFAGDANAVSAKTTVTGLNLIKMNGVSSVPDAVVFDMTNITDGAPRLASTTNSELPTWDLSAIATGTDVHAFSEVPYAVTNAPAGVAYIIAPFVTASAEAGTFEYTFRVDYTVEINAVTEVRTADVNVDLTESSSPFAGNTAGKAWNLNFQFEGNQITAVATVTEWEFIDIITTPI